MTKKNNSRGDEKQRNAAPAVASKTGATRVVESRSSPDGARREAERTYTIADWRLEKPELRVSMARDSSGATRYTVKGKLDAPVPPIRESKYLNKEKSLELYRWMLLNRRME